MSEWENRELCPDGNCVGVIGADGTCKVCGRAAPNWGDERRRGLVDEDDAEENANDDPSHPLILSEHGAERRAQSKDDPSHPLILSEHGAERRAQSKDGEADGRDEWDQRTLCPDGACTGVITGAGACSVCGRSAAEIAAESPT